MPTRSHLPPSPLPRTTRSSSKVKLFPKEEESDSEPDDKKAFAPRPTRFQRALADANDQGAKTKPRKHERREIMLAPRMSEDVYASISLQLNGQRHKVIATVPLLFNPLEPELFLWCVGRDGATP